MDAKTGDRITIKSAHTGNKWEGTVIWTYWYHPGNGYGYSHQVYRVETGSGNVMDVRMGRDGDFIQEDHNVNYQ